MLGPACLYDRCLVQKYYQNYQVWQQSNVPYWTLKYVRFTNTGSSTRRNYKERSRIKINTYWWLNFPPERYTSPETRCKNEKLKKNVCAAHTNSIGRLVRNLKSNVRLASLFWGSGKSRFVTNSYWRRAPRLHTFITFARMLGCEASLNLPLFSYERADTVLLYVGIKRKHMWKHEEEKLSTRATMLALALMSEIVISSTICIPSTSASNARQYSPICVVQGYSS